MKLIIAGSRNTADAADEVCCAIYEDDDEPDVMYKAGLAMLTHPYDYGPFIVGYEAEKLLETMSVQQIREKFVADMKERLGIDVPPGKVRLDYGVDYDG